MFRLMVIIDKRADLSDEQFRDYYENTHIPFIAKTAPAKVIRYRRNYVVGAHPLAERLATARQDSSSTISAITEIGFESEADAEEMVAILTSAAARDAVIQDEANFIASGGVRWHVLAG